MTGDFEEKVPWIVKSVEDRREKDLVKSTLFSMTFSEGKKSCGMGCAIRGRYKVLTAYFLISRKK
jgi:hypothetical protein